jgi:hypothetical protein
MLVQQLRTAQFDWSVLTRQSDGAETGILKSYLDPYINSLCAPTVRSINATWTGNRRIHVNITAY